MQCVILVRTCFVTTLERARKIQQPPETTDMPVRCSLKLLYIIHLCYHQSNCDQLTICRMSKLTVLNECTVLRFFPPYYFY